MPLLARRLTLALLLTLCWSAILTADTVHRTFAVADGGRLDLKADVGSIDVESGGNGVDVRIERIDNPKDFDTTVEQQGNDVVVRLKYRGATNFFHWFDNGQVRFVITVPRRYNLLLDTAGGDIRIGDLEGEVKCHTSGGSLRFGKIVGPIDGSTSGGSIVVGGSVGRLIVKTSGGDIRIADSRGPAEARTSGGSVEIEHVVGDVLARSSGGSIHIADVAGAVDADTSGGSVTARITRQPTGDSRLSTSGGGVRVEIASNLAVDLDAHTSGGEVSTDIPVTVVGKQGESDLKGKINGGGPRLVLRSSGGGIHVSRF
jgi:DUF4097 and DUF4098 domain-containing protein YvlB